MDTRVQTRRSASQHSAQLQTAPTEGIRLPTRIFRRNEHLMHAGDRVKCAYQVVSGVFKSYINHENGDNQVLGFHVPGDVLGHEILLDGVSGRHVMALDTSSVKRLDTRDETTSQLLTESLYDEVSRLTRQLHLEREYCTDARLAAFLLDYSHAQARRGCSRYDFILPMRRRDLAGYLGLATETLSRVFSRFRSRGILSVNTNHITVRDCAMLREIAGRERTEPDQQIAH